MIKIKTTILLLSLCISISSADYIKNTNNLVDTYTVFDTSTGLLWSDVDTFASSNFTDAIAYCEGLDLAGINTWKLPTFNQLFMLSNRKYSEPAINTTQFANTKNAKYWSSTTNVINLSQAWSVDFKDGSISKDDKTSTNYIRCVSQ